MLVWVGTLMLGLAQQVGAYAQTLEDCNVVKLAGNPMDATIASLLGDYVKDVSPAGQTYYEGPTTTDICLSHECTITWKLYYFQTTKGSAWAIGNDIQSTKVLLYSESLPNAEANSDVFLVTNSWMATTTGKPASVRISCAADAAVLATSRGKRGKGHFDFIEIGTSDYGTLLQEADEHTSGLSIEPLAYYQDRLPDRPLVKKINCAMLDEDGTIPMYFVPDEVIKKHGLPNFVRGCGALGSRHNLVTQVLKSKNLDPDGIFSEKLIPIVSFPTLVKNYSIESVGKLKIDAEGQDHKIMQSYVEACSANLGLAAPEIRFENPHLNNPDTDVNCETDANGKLDCKFKQGKEMRQQLLSIVRFFVRLGYAVFGDNADTYLIADANISSLSQLKKQISWGFADSDDDAMIDKAAALAWEEQKKAKEEL